MREYFIQKQDGNMLYKMYEFITSVAVVLSGIIFGLFFKGIYNVFRYGVRIENIEKSVSEIKNNCSSHKSEHILTEIRLLRQEFEDYKLYNKNQN